MSIEFIEKIQKIARRIFSHGRCVGQLSKGLYSVTVLK